MNSLQFRKKQLQYLGFLLGWKPERIEIVVNNINRYYYIKKEYKKNSSTGEFKTYKDGNRKLRILRPSKGELKIIQERINKNIFSKIQYPINIHGGMRGCSNITNAKPHKGNQYILTTDLKGFYPSISHQQVYQAFQGLEYGSTCSYWLTKLTTYRGELPQGTPTSPHLANLVYYPIDKELIQFCDKHNLTYTRYVDDLTFSSPFDFQNAIKDLFEIIQTSSFQISHRKTSYNSRQEITGIDVSREIMTAPRRIQDKADLEVSLMLFETPYWDYVRNIQKVSLLKS